LRTPEQKTFEISAGDLNIKKLKRTGGSVGLKQAKKLVIERDYILKLKRVNQESMY